MTDRLTDRYVRTNDYVTDRTGPVRTGDCIEYCFHSILANFTKCESSIESPTELGLKFIFTRLSRKRPVVNRCVSGRFGGSEILSECTCFLECSVGKHRDVCHTQERAPLRHSGPLGLPESRSYERTSRQFHTGQCAVTSRHA